MIRHSSRRMRASALVAVVLATTATASPAAAFEPAAPGCHSRPKPHTARGFQACAAIDLHLLTQTEDAGSIVGADHEAIAAVGGQILAARLLCREGRFDEGLDIYTRVAADGPSARWLR